MAEAWQVLVWITLFLYGTAAVISVGYLPFPHWQRSARWATWLAWGVHTISLGMHLWATGRPPFLSLFESVLFFSWVVVLNYVLIDWLMDVRAMGSFLVPLVFWFLLGALALPRSLGSFGGNLSGRWLITHVVFAFLAYGLLLMGFVTALMYLIQEKQLRGKAWGSLYYRLPSLEALDRLSSRLVVAGFGMLTIAIITGSVWARPSWGRYWGWDSKEVWSFVSWAIYGAYLAARGLAGWRGRKVAWLSMVGFLSILFNFLAVNLLFTRLHRFNL